MIIDTFKQVFREETVKYLRRMSCKLKHNDKIKNMKKWHNDKKKPAARFLITMTRSEANKAMQRTTSPIIPGVIYSVKFASSVTITIITVRLKLLIKIK